MMAKASIVSAQQQQALARIEAKLDLLLKESGLTFESGVPGEPPKPTKSFAVPQAQPAAPVAEPEPAKPAKKTKG
jgi:hypothetical protein